MPFRFITKSIHAYWIDYPVAVLLMIAPFVLGLGQTNSVAFWLSIIVGVAALLLAAITDHATGIIRIIPYWLHLWVDRAVGVVFVFAPFVFNFTESRRLVLLGPRGGSPPYYLSFQRARANHLPSFQPRHARSNVEVRLS